MSNNQGEPDIFDDIVSLDSKHYEEGLSKGHKIGEELAIQESEQFGFKSGIDLADEIGYYQGIVDTLETLIHTFPSYEEKKERIDKVYGDLRQLLIPFEVLDPYDEEFNKKVTKIRTTFKILAALLKMKVSAQQDDL